MKEQIKAPEKIQLSDKEIGNLSDAQFKTLVIRKLTELVELGHKLDEKMKAMLRETKENVQGTNSDGKEMGLKSTVWTLSLIHISEPTRRVDGSRMPSSA